MTKTHKFFCLALILSLGLIGFSSIQAQDEVTADEDIQAADLEVGQPTVLPDSPFYFLKEWGRGIRSFFVFNALDKAELESRFANEKLIEMKRMIEENKSAEEVEAATENYQESIEKINQITERIRERAENNQRVGSFLDKFTQHQALHQRLLQRLENQVSSQAQGKIEQVRERHLERFRDVMLKLEEKDKIPERLENNLQKLRGSNFKEIKNLQFLEEIEEKMPEEVKERIEQKKEEIMERLRERLENMPPEEQGKLEEYLGDISGDELTVLDVFNALESKGLPENLEQIMERVKEQKVERITNRFQERIRQEAVSKERAEDKIKEAEESLDDLQKLITDREEVNQDDMPAVFRLLEESEKKLETAKEEFENQNYGRAYGQAVASLSLSRNAIRIIKIRAGFNTEIENLACAEVYNPVCGEDGTTYGNICKAKQAGVKITYRGECKEDMECAGERERVNRNPLLGPTSQSCCEGLQEVRVSRSYSVCRSPDATFECQQDEDCPLPRCSGLESKCVDGRCVIPRCEEPVACIQVITPAKNPNTGECRNFPTPCDVPEGWEKVEACENIRARIEEAIQNRARSLSPSSAQ